MKCWRVGTTWGKYPIIKIFEKYQIAFFGIDSDKIGRYWDAKPGDLLAITGYNSLNVKAIAKMETNFVDFSSFPDYIKNDEELSFISKDAKACQILIVNITDENDSFAVSDRKRFYELNSTDSINTNNCWVKYFTNKVKKIEESKIFNFYELGTICQNFIKIPAVQRGLVWKPQQTELLWDSILRGFPIGSFILYSDANSSGFDLMDGQQRYNAISLGFNSSKNDRAKLWFDLGGERKKNSTRKFWIKATTKAHPWGYKNDDECSFLSAGERRKALEKYFGNNDKTLAKDDISLDDTWPIEAKYPIPLNILIRHLNCTSSLEFYEACINDHEFKLLPQSLKQNNDLLGNDVKYLIENIFPVFKKIKEIIIPFSILQKEVLESETENFDADSDLEVLFRRITSGGTQITQPELSYSAIKVYWPSIRNICEEVSAFCMPAHSLAILVFRLYLVLKENKWISSVSIKKIRELSETDDKEIELLFKDNIRTIINSINDYLCNDTNGVPSVLRTDLARNFPDIFLLLMWFEYKKAKLFGDEKLALAYFIKWFTSFPSDCVQSIFSQSINGITKETVLVGLLNYKMNHEEDNLHWLCSPEEFNELQGKFPFEKNWRKWNSANEKYFTLWNSFVKDPRKHPDFLIYAEREFFKDEFKKYDPSKKDLWASHNRPWDFDHIVPHDWIYNKKSGFWRQYDNEWINTVGNFAAIPFEKNREKSNFNDWGYYKDKDHEKKLFFCEDIEKCKSDIIHSEKQSRIFMECTKIRTSHIYSEIFNLMENFFKNTSINGKVNFPIDSAVYKRKEIYEEFKMLLEERGYMPKFRCIDNSGYESDFNLVNNYKDWTWPWISLEIPGRNDCFVYSITANKVNSFEIGLRLAPGLKEKNSDFTCDIEGFSADGPDGWWYAVKRVNKKEDVIEQLLELLKKDV